MSKLNSNRVKEMDKGAPSHCNIAPYALAELIPKIYLFSLFVHLLVIIRLTM